MSIKNHAQMHQNHLAWNSEKSCWREDLRNWQHELAQAFVNLKELDADLKQHEQTLRQHAAAIRLNEEIVDAHEHSLAEFERGGQGTDLPLLAKQHRKEQEKHDQLRAVHEDLKRRHHFVIAHLNLLLKAFPKTAPENKK